VVTLPIPYYVGGAEVAPALRLGFLASLVVGVALTEGGGGYLGLLAWLAAGQAVVWLLLLFGAASLATRLLRPAPAGLRSGILALAAALLFTASAFGIYSTELSSRGPVSNLAGIFD
jgi:hypothetical protein